jgi:transposase
LVFNTTLPHVDPFHPVKLATSMLDDVRRRVPGSLTPDHPHIKHQGRRYDPLFRARRRMAMAAERHSDNSKKKLLEIMATGDPKGEVTEAWHAN